MKKVFILGVGAQKSGTTWLHDYLSACPHVNLGAMKEYHIWDALHNENCKYFIADKREPLRHDLQRIEGAYERYFDSLINSKITHTGDITPSYSGLNEYSFRLIRAKLERLGFKVKVVFIMRDPFERCWSAVRMKRRFISNPISELDDLSKSYKTLDFILRTDYKKTVQSLNFAFDHIDIYYGIYEVMFTPRNIKNLSDFCGVSYLPDFSNMKIHVSPKFDIEPLKIRSEIMSYYRHVYEFCWDKFPDTKNLWHQFN
jgi:hypothetical protein